MLRAVITQLSRSQTRRTKRSGLHESAQKSSPHEEGTTSTRSTVQTEEREPPNLADPDGDTREQDRLYNYMYICCIGRQINSARQPRTNACTLQTNA